MTFIGRLMAWCKYERGRMKVLLERLKFGEEKVEPWPTIPGQVDTTPSDIALYERKIAEMDDLIARHPDDK